MILAGEIMIMTIILSIILMIVGIGLLILVHVCIVGRALRRGFGNPNSIPMVERGINNITTTTNTTINTNASTTSMSKGDLEKLPCFDYMTKETSLDLDCTICLDIFQVGDKCRLLPLCNHTFHSHCIDAWLLKKPFCPICRASAEIDNTESRDNTGSQHSITPS